jgi:hypothetical protein
MANSHKAKLEEAQAQQEALSNADQLIESSIVDLAKGIAAKLVNKIAEVKETLVSSDPTIRKEQEFIRKVSSQNLRSECEALGTAAGQTARKAVDVAYGATKGLVRGITTGGSNPSKGKASKSSK